MTVTERFRPTWLEIDLSMIAHNARLLRALLPEHVKMLAVVKADAYGHGANPVARVALDAGADFLAVALPEEGAALREHGIEAPILVLGGIDGAGAGAAARYRLTQTVFDVETVRLLAEAAELRDTVVDVHIKIDSGMGRIGVRDAAELQTLADAIIASPRLRLTGAFTHFAVSDADDLAYTHRQNDRFTALIAPLRARVPGLIAHAANSAALLRCPFAHHDMARAGIALYENPRFPGGVGEGLREAMRWVTHAVHVKTIDPGETVSYGRIFTAERETRVMTLPVGYADGYHRVIGGKGCALVRGRRAPVIGRVCMDQIMLDVTDIPGASVGDEVVLLGAQGDDAITMREMGDWCGMIDYEVMLSPSARVPRIWL